MYWSAEYSILIIMYLWYEYVYEDSLERVVSVLLETDAPLLPTDTPISTCYPTRCAS